MPRKYPNASFMGNVLRFLANDMHLCRKKKHSVNSSSPSRNRDEGVIIGARGVNHRRLQATWHLMSISPSHHHIRLVSAFEQTFFGQFSLAVLLVWFLQEATGCRIFIRGKDVKLWRLDIRLAFGGWIQPLKAAVSQVEKTGYWWQVSGRWGKKYASTCLEP